MGDTVGTRFRQQSDGKAYLSRPGHDLVNWNMVSKVRASTRKARVLKVLSNGEMDLRAIGRLTRLERSNAQRTVQSLCEQGLVRCLTPNQFRSKIYQVTSQGVLVYKEVERLW